MFLDNMARNFDKTTTELFNYATKSSRLYRRYNIQKRGGGFRTIFHPSKELKKYQRFILKEIFSKLPVHKNVYSYKKNTSIVDLADIHKNNRFLLRVDFSNFFPSIKGENIRNFLEENNDNLEYKLSSKDITIINLFVCKNNRLTIGAPSSPQISNVILYLFDRYMDEYCNKKNIKYSRYADDLYFSTNCSYELNKVLQMIKEYKFEHGIKLKINEAKNIFTSKKKKRNITGLTITTNNEVSIGRDNKRFIKSLINQYRYNELNEEKVNYLKGYLSFIYSVEPSYLFNLKEKYGDSLIDDLLILKENH